MESVLKSVLKEELDRNLQKQRIFRNEFNKCQKGSLIVARIHGDSYLYRKYRDKEKIVSVYIGAVDSEAAKNARKERSRYIKLKRDLKDLKNEEFAIRKAIKIYG